MGIWVLYAHPGVTADSTRVPARVLSALASNDHDTRTGMSSSLHDSFVANVVCH
jgi:hypothetical protein